MRIDPIEIKIEENENGLDRQIETIAVEPWSPSMGISEEEYYNKAFEELDRMEESDIMQNGQNAAEKRYILPEEDPGYNDMSWMYSEDDIPSADELDDEMIEVNLNDPNADKGLKEKLSSKHDDKISQSYFEARREELNRKAEEYAYDNFVRSGDAIRQLAESLNGRVNDMGEIVNAIANANTQNANAKRLFHNPNKKNGTYVSPEFDIINGRFVRKYTPYFSVGNNKYKDAFMYFSRFPNDPRFEQVKKLFIEEEQRLVECNKNFHRRLSNDTSAEFEKQLDLMCNPYTLHGPEAPKIEEKAFMNPDDEVLWETPIDIEFDFSINGKVYEHKIHEVDVVTRKELRERTEMKIRRAMEMEFDINAAYKAHCINNLARRQKILDEKCPGWDTEGREWLRDPKNMATYIEEAIEKPYRKLQEFQKKRTVPKCPDFETYCRNLGMNLMSDLATGNSEADMIIKKLGVSPDNPYFAECIQMRERQEKWVSEVFLSDGKLNMDYFRKKYPNFDAMREAHRLSILYDDTRHSTIMARGATIKLPPSIEETLSDEVKHCLRMTQDEPDYDYMHDVCTKLGKDVDEVFDLRYNPFRDKIDHDGHALTIRDYEERKKNKVKLPLFVEDLNTVPEQYRRLYTQHPITKNWFNTKSPKEDTYLPGTEEDPNYVAPPTHISPDDPNFNIDDF